MDVMIGVDPHKGSHTATMLDRGEQELRRITVRAGRRQVDQLLEWAGDVGPRTWAVESAGWDGPSAVPAVGRRRRDGVERPGDVGVTGARFATASRFAAYTGTAPIEFSSGGRITHRLSRRGNRRLNHALHIAAITQIRYPHSPGRRYDERKLTEGKTPREAVRSLKRRLSDVVWRDLVADARRVTN
jgi:Transposase IS116/IS110/IS902 family